MNKLILSIMIVVLVSITATTAETGFWPFDHLDGDVNGVLEKTELNDLRRVCDLVEFPLEEKMNLEQFQGMLQDLSKHFETFFDRLDGVVKKDEVVTLDEFIKGIYKFHSPEYKSEEEVEEKFGLIFTKFASEQKQNGHAGDNESFDLYQLKSHFDMIMKPDCWLFNHLDEDNNNVLDFTEFEEFSIPFAQVSNAQLTPLSKGETMDVDRFLEILETLKAELQEFFKFMDHMETNGVVTEDEYMTAMNRLHRDLNIEDVQVRFGPIFTMITAEERENGKSGYSDFDMYQLKGVFNMNN